MMLPKESATFSSCRFNCFMAFLIPNSRYEERMQETARVLDQKHRLEEKINELNTQPKNSKK